jgi:isocitrate dehydrogenase (NAD+)
LKQAGRVALEQSGSPLPEDVIASIKQTRVALKGPVTTPVAKGFRSVNVALRQALGLFVCLRPCKSYKGARTRYDNVDLVVIRENTEDLYAGVEIQRGTEEASHLRELLREKRIGQIPEDAGVGIKWHSVTGTKRLVRWAFEYARTNRRRKVTAVHKGNILKFTDGLFLQVASEVAKEYPDIAFDDRIVDNMCMQLVQKPELYDVLVLPNLYGDIVSDLCAGLVGGLGLAPGGNYGEGDVAIFEPTHGSAPKYAGLNKVNPSATILSGLLMLRHLKEHDAANRLEMAFASVLAEGKNVTYDIKNDPNDPSVVGTSQFADAIIARMKEI